MINWLLRKAGVREKVHRWLSCSFHTGTEQLYEGEVVRELHEREMEVLEVTEDHVVLEPVHGDGHRFATAGMVRVADSHHDLPLYTMGGILYKERR